MWLDERRAARPGESVLQAMEGEIRTIAPAVKPPKPPKSTVNKAKKTRPSQEPPLL